MMRGAMTIPYFSMNRLWQAHRCQATHRQHAVMIAVVKNTRTNVLRSIITLSLGLSRGRLERRFRLVPVSGDCRHGCCVGLRIRVVAPSPRQEQQQCDPHNQRSK